MFSILLVSSVQIDVLGGERKIGLQTTEVRSTRLLAVLFVEALEKYRGKCGRKGRKRYLFEEQSRGEYPSHSSSLLRVHQAPIAASVRPPQKFSRMACYSYLLAVPFHPASYDTIHASFPRSFVVPGYDSSFVNMHLVI